MSYETSVFQMDTFNRNGTCYCSSDVDIIQSPKYVSLDNLDFYNKMIHDEDIPANRVKLDDGRTLQEIINDLVNKHAINNFKIKFPYSILKRSELKTSRQPYP